MPQDLGQDLAKTRRMLEDRRNKQAAADRTRRQEARRTGILPKRPKPKSPLDLVKAAVGAKRLKGNPLNH
jgi:hypothetical protein